MFKHVITATAALGILAASLIAATPASAASCTNIDVSFARGTGQPAGLGTVGTPFTQAYIADVPTKTVSVYAVNYAADLTQLSAGPGAKDLVNHLTTVAAACPNTVFVLGGYSQGATVIDNAIGLTTPSSTLGATIPTTITPKIKAIVVFGNPIGNSHRTIETSSPTYGPRTKSFCNTGDPVCGNGLKPTAHTAYATDGSAQTAATYAATKTP